MRFARWIPKAKYTHSEYVILIAFRLQQWLHERVSILSYTYIACYDSVYQRMIQSTHAFFITKTSSVCIILCILCLLDRASS